MCGAPSDPVYVTDYGCLGEVGLEDAEREVGALFLLCLAGTLLTTWLFPGKTA